MTTEVFSRLIRYLKLLDKEYQIAEENKEIIVYEYVDGKKEEIRIHLEGSWIDTFWKGPNIAEFRKDPEKYILFLELALRLNSVIREAKIGLGEDDHVYAIIHSRVDALTFDVFESEYKSLPYAIKAIKEQIETTKKYESV
ncbi:MAG: hypothetical protein Q6363_000030 [Candidatus Njordarchaeota archaeon]